MKSSRDFFLGLILDFSGFGTLSPQGKPVPSPTPTDTMFSTTEVAPKIPIAAYPWLRHGKNSGDNVRPRPRIRLKKGMP